jgi:hypothetical protein
MVLLSTLTCGCRRLTRAARSPTRRGEPERARGLALAPEERVQRGHGLAAAWVGSDGEVTAPAA